jgi:hypothetical protein
MKKDQYPQYDVVRTIADMQKQIASLQASAIGSANRTDFQTTWSATTTAPVLGNGTLTSTYIRTGALCWFNISLGMGSTTTFGSGTWTFTVPFQMDATSNTFCGSAIAHQVSGSAWSSGAAYSTDTTNNLITVVFGANVFQADATHPFTWTTGDSLTVTMTYPTTQ